MVDSSSTTVVLLDSIGSAERNGLERDLSNRPCGDQTIGRVRKQYHLTGIDGIIRKYLKTAFATSAEMSTRPSRWTVKAPAVIVREVEARGRYLSGSTNTSSARSEYV